MATKLYLSRANSALRVPKIGAGTDLLTTNNPQNPVTEYFATCTASGTEIQLGNADYNWITGRAPAGGFTLTSTDISLWLYETAMTTNAGGRYRLYHYSTSAVVTEIGGGPFNDGVEAGTGYAEMTWTGNNTDQVFLEDERLLLRCFATNAGTMGTGSLGLKWGAAEGTEGDSFLNLAETVLFKPDIDWRWTHTPYDTNLRR